MTPIPGDAAFALFRMRVMIIARLSRLLVVFVVVDFGKLRVDHVVLGGILCGILGRIALGLLLVHGLAELHRSLRQRVGLGLDRLGIVTLQRFFSSAALASASLTIFWMSASDRPPEAWIRICCSLPVALSLADTLTMPLASMSKVTSICGMPRGAGGMPIRSN